MTTPIIIFLRFMWRFRGLLAIAFLIILGHMAQRRDSRLGQLAPAASLLR